MNGNPGCLPDANYAYATKKEARDALKNTMILLRDNGDKYRGNLKQGYFASIEGNYYADIEECQEDNCMKELEE